MIVDRDAYGCYAVSPDGVCWETPNLGMVSFRGSRRNNIFYRGVNRKNVAICPNVIKLGPGDWHMFYWDSMTPRCRRGVIHYTSADGLRWRRGRVNPVVQTPVDRTQSGGVEDVLRVSYDAAEKRFLLSQRTLPLENLERPMLQAKVPSGLTQRRVSIAFSRDGARFTPMRTVLTPALNDPPDLQFYGLSPFRYEDHYLGYLLCYRTDRPNMDVELAYSPDAERWTRVSPNTRYIANGPKGSYDCGLIHCSPHPTPAGDRHFIYYLGTNSNHARGTVDGKPLRTGLCLATAEPDRLVSVRAGTKTGSVLVGPVRLGRRLLLNVDAGRGEAMAALRRPDTRETLPGFSADECDKVCADAPGHAVTWRGNDVARLAGRRALVQVTLRDADLFSVASV
jgi:hypothetical protein